MRALFNLPTFVLVISRKGFYQRGIAGTKMCETDNLEVYQEETVLGMTTLAALVEHSLLFVGVFGVVSLRV